MFVWGLMSYLSYLHLFAYSGVQHILFCVFVLFFFILCTLCCQFLWIVHFLPCKSSGEQWWWRRWFWSKYKVLGWYMYIIPMLLRNCDVFHLKFRHKETQCNILFNNRRCFYNQLLSDLFPTQTRQKAPLNTSLSTGSFVTYSSLYWNISWLVF
jgi:hypothetical protein